MNPDHAQRHADYPPMIEQYRGPLIAPPMQPKRVHLVRLYAPDYAAPTRRTVVMIEPSLAASKVTFWSWLGLMCSLAVVTIFFILSNDIWHRYWGAENALVEFLSFILFSISGLWGSLWSMFRYRQAYNPRRVLVSGLLATAVDLVIITFFIYTLIAMPHIYYY